MLSDLSALLFSFPLSPVWRITEVQVSFILLSFFKLKKKGKKRFIHPILCMNAGKHISVCLVLGRSEDSIAFSETGLWITVNHYVWMLRIKLLSSLLFFYMPFLTIIIIVLQSCGLSTLSLYIVLCINRAPCFLLSLCRTVVLSWSSTFLLTK